MSATKQRRGTERKPKPVEIGPEHRPILEELKSTYGTYKNAVGKALECLHKQREQQQGQSAAGQ